MADFADRIGGYFSSGYHLKAFTISVLLRSLTAAAAVLVYQVVFSVISENIHFAEFISTGVVMMFSVLVLLPVQKKSGLWLGDRLMSGYLVDDKTASRAAYKNMDMDTVLRYVFPDMVNVTGGKSGEMAVLGEDGEFSIYHYSSGKQRKVRTSRGIDLNSPLLKFLNVVKAGVSLADTLADSEVNSEFVRLRANYIQPFIFREKLFGFVALSSIPTEKQIAKLNILASKSAITIFNSLLSSAVAEKRKYKREFEDADRIRKLIQFNRIMDIPGFSVILEGNDPSTFVDFYKNGNVYYFVVFRVNLNHQGSVLVLSYILGTLYSYFNSGENVTVTAISRRVGDVLSGIFYDDKYDLLVGKINSAAVNVDLVLAGENISVEIDSRGGTLRKNMVVSKNLSGSPLKVDVNGQIRLEIVLS